MKKIFKSRIFIFILGVLVMAGIGYGVYAINAEEIAYENGTVKSALDDLYSSIGSGVMGVEHIQSTTTTYTLPSFPTYTWESGDTDLIQVSNGAATIAGAGDVYLEKNGVRYFKIELEYVGPALTLVAGKYCTGNTCATSDNNGITTGVFESLTDGVKTKQGTYDTVLIGSSDRYLKFVVAKPLSITFSSGSYSDGGGSTGHTANFYKLDGSSNEVLYTSFTQQNDTQDYETKHFDAGTYVVRASGGYISFSEWTITED